MSKAIQFRNRNNEKIYPCPYYPIGSIYLSVNSTNPGTIFGGTWQRLTGGFLYGCVNASGSGNGTGTSTGGSSVNTGSTTLTVNQIPSHQNLLKMKNNGKWNWNDGSAPGDKMEGGYSWDSGNVTYNWLIENSPVGGNQGHTHSLNSHTHAVPYIAVYAWKRVS